MKERLCHHGGFGQYFALRKIVCEILNFFFLVPFPRCLILLVLVHFLHLLLPLTLLALLAHIHNLLPPIGLGLVLDEDLARTVGEVDAELKRGAAGGCAAGRGRAAGRGGSGRVLAAR